MRKIKFKVTYEFEASPGKMHTRTVIIKIPEHLISGHSQLFEHYTILSVQQYTGREDMFSKEVYENDKITFKWGSYYPFTGKVYFSKDGQWKVKVLSEPRHTPWKGKGRMGWRLLRDVCEIGIMED